MAITIIVLLIIIAAAGLYTVEQQHVAMVERFGKFVKVSQPGIHVRIPIVDQIAGRPSLRVLQLDNMIQTKTKDNVFVNVQVPVQYCIDPNNIVEAFYKLNKPEIQIKAYVEDAIRSAIPGLTLDDAFEKKDDIAKTVQEIITEEMSKFGFIILKALITEIDPDEKVRASMNDINAAQRQRAAAQELAEADKIKVVIKAQAEAEEARLRGLGIAEQRKAIVDGLSASFNELKTSGLTENEIMSILITNQYLDTLNKFADKGNATLFLPSSPEGVEDMRTQLLSSLSANNTMNRNANRAE